EWHDLRKRVELRLPFAEGSLPDEEVPDEVGSIGEGEYDRRHQRAAQDEANRARSAEGVAQVGKKPTDVGVDGRNQRDERAGGYSPCEWTREAKQPDSPEPHSGDRGRDDPAQREAEHPALKTRARAKPPRSRRSSLCLSRPSGHSGPGR